MWDKSSIPCASYFAGIEPKRVRDQAEDLGLDPGTCQCCHEPPLPSPISTRTLPQLKCIYMIQWLEVNDWMLVARLDVSSLGL